MSISRDEIDKILKKYQSKLNKQIGPSGLENYKPSSEFSREYTKFKEEAMPKRLSAYEKLCNFSETVIKVNPSEKDVGSLQESIRVAHLNLTPTGAASFSLLFVSLVVIFSLFAGGASYFVSGFKSFGGLLAAIIVSLVAILLIKPLTRYPINIATKWRLKASDQMVLCVLYMVIYMRHTSNFENAIKFASEHVGEPLSLDLRKIFWDVETGKYPTLKESLETYLGYWRKYNLEFVNAMHLLESSLYEPAEERRLSLLDKSLEVILEGTYDRMLKYAHDLQSPITMLHMLGVILPILGLVIFPLIGTFLGGVKWYYLAIVYNIALPLIVYNVGVSLLNKRPAGYGETKLDIPSKKGILAFAWFIFLAFLIIGLLPFIIHFISPGFDVSLYGDPATGEKLLDFELAGGKYFGPFGMGALMMSFFIPLGLALSLSMYYKSKSKVGKKIRDETKKLESEFSTGIFQLGTRIGDGIPSEVAFDDVSKTLEGTPVGKFFRMVHTNLSTAGMSLKNAIFGRERGAIKDYPSPLVKSAMEVLVESSRKGPKVVSQSLLSISTYVNNVKRINERLKDLLAEIISSMKSQINFMAPVIAGIVVGIASMIVGIISKLGYMLQQVNSGATDFSVDIVNLSSLFQKTQTIPSYFFQLIVGIYIVQIIYILTIISNGIEHGADKLNEQHSLGKNLMRGFLLYLVIAVIVVIVFNMIAGTVLSSTQI